MNAPTSGSTWLDAASVTPEVFALRPDYRALLVLAEGLVPGPSDDHSERLLVEAEHRMAQRLQGGRPEELPEIAAWRDAYRAFGAKPQRTRPSVEALVRRIDDGLPRIDRITDTYNAISVAHLLPLGGEDADRYDGPARLGRATGEESFEVVVAGDPGTEHPEAGEVVWTDDAGVTCRRWNWRQSPRTRISLHTTNALFIIDGLLDATPGIAINEAAEALRSGLAAFSPGARFSSRLLAP